MAQQDTVSAPAVAVVEEGTPHRARGTQAAPEQPETPSAPTPDLQALVHQMAAMQVQMGAMMTHMLEQVRN